MRSELIQLLDRMTDKSVDALDSRDYPQTVAWNAHRDAEKLTDRSIVDELVDYIQKERSEPLRRNAHFIIGKIGKNNQDETCAEILIGELKRAKSKYTIGGLLDRIRDIPKPIEVDLDPVYALLSDSRPSVRHSAICALINSSHPESEERVIQVLIETEDHFDQIYCNSTLNLIGTAQAIPYLEKFTKAKNQDVKMSARLAIEAIKQRASSEM